MRYVYKNKKGNDIAIPFYNQGLKDLFSFFEDVSCDVDTLAIFIT